MLVGDVIIGARELIPDLPSVVGLPVGGSLNSSIVAAVGSTLPIANYRAKYAGVNQWGETLPSGEFAGVGLNITAIDQGIQITSPTLAQIPGAVRIRVYLGTVANGQNMWYESSTIPFTISTVGNPGAPAIKNTAYYPDANGRFASAFTMYRWLNEAIEEASRVCGGIPDISGFRTIQDNPIYALPGHWTKVTDAWWDGYPVALAGAESMFYRNRVPGVTGRSVLSANTDRILFELQPQPNRSGASTTLAADFSLTDTVATLTSTAGFKLTFGLAKIGNEIVSYSNIAGNTLTGIVRGLGGTTQAASLATAPVEELNYRFAGLRNFTNPNYIPGDATKTVPVPPGWRVPLIEYVLGKAREAEQDYRESQRHMSAFLQMVQATIRGNKIVAGPRQVGGYAGQDIWPSAAWSAGGGGYIIP